MKTQSCLIGPVACLLLIFGVPRNAKSPGSVQERLAEQNVLFDEYYETELKTHPEDGHGLRGLSL